MSGWISSKLKVAEALLQQIDQQAAESLRKNDKSRSDELIRDSPKKRTDLLPVKDQLKKTTPEAIDFVRKLGSDTNLNDIDHDRVKEIVKGGSLKPGLTDSDWTELLNAPSKTSNGSNGVPRVRGLQTHGRRQSRSGTISLPLEGRRNQKAENSFPLSSRKKDVPLVYEVNGGGLGERQSDREDVEFSDSTRSSVELQGFGESLDRERLSSEDASRSIVLQHRESVRHENDLATIGSVENLPSVDLLVDGIDMKDERSPLTLANINEISNLKTGLTVDKFRKRGSSASDSDTDSGSSSDSENELEREERRIRREQILAERAAAKAVEAIKERENLVARLEGEKQSLEKILEERTKEQAQEASELQLSMMETMEAVDLEKQKHNNTRMEALPRLAKLETANADLAKSLAAAQWNLEVEVNRVAEVRRHIELKQASQDELRRKILGSHQTGNRLVASRGVEFEHGILEAECNFIVDKVEQLQEKAKTLETSIETTRRKMENPTEVEVELKRRLGQLTNHLIHKQAQVEALSSEKATLLFRIEAVSRMLEENKPALNKFDHTGDDIELGKWDPPNSRVSPMFEQRLRSGQKHLGSLVVQLDSIFSAGVVFLRRNPTARIWSFGYLICLHVWVLYILISHSSGEARSSAVMSLENINSTGGI